MNTLISISSSSAFVGEITKFFEPLMDAPSTFTMVDAVETMVFFSKVNKSVESSKITTSSTCNSPVKIFLDCTKNLAKVSPNGTNIFPVRFASLSENSELISSIFNTLFVLTCMNFASFVFLSWINFDFDPLSIVSISCAKSKLCIASTLCSEITSAETTVKFDTPIPAEDVDVIPVSAKFFNPLVCNKRFTGSTIWSNVLGLCIVYDRFW